MELDDPIKSNDWLCRPRNDLRDGSFLARSDTREGERVDNSVAAQIAKGGCQGDLEAGLGQAVRRDPRKLSR